MENEIYYEARRKACVDLHNFCADILKKQLTPRQLEKMREETPQQASAKPHRKSDKRLKRKKVEKMNSPI